MSIRTHLSNAQSKRKQKVYCRSALEKVIEKDVVADV